MEAKAANSGIDKIIPLESPMGGAIVENQRTATVLP